jgi:hypothetical protein
MYTVLSCNPAKASQLIGRSDSILAIFTTQTCGESCWHAREDVCRCSCGGKNHGCLSHGGERPERTAKLDGERYKLVGVGNYRDLYSDAERINREAGYRSVEKPVRYGERWVQYYYTWSETDAGAPARLKTASKSQMNWQELAGWRDARNGVYLLWQRVQMPERPTQLKIDFDTGIPLADQNPPNRINPNPESIDAI